MIIAGVQVKVVVEAILILMVLLMVIVWIILVYVNNGHLKEDAMEVKV